MIVKYPNDSLLDDTVILWRYISFSKFVSLLMSIQLHFTRADKFLDTWSFAHERELRAVIVNPPGTAAKKSEGVLIEVDLNELITQVFIHPKAKHWFRETVQSVCRQYGLNAEPLQSHLYDEPLF